MSSVVVVGGGKIGAHVLTMLAGAGHDLWMVELDPARATELAGQFPQSHVVTGSGTDAVVLEQAGIRGCDVVAAVTGTDVTNLAVAALARFEFGVPRVIARIVDPANAWMFEPDLGVDVALNQADILAHLIAEEMSLGERTILLTLRRGQYSLVEEKVSAGSAVVGRPLHEVRWPVGSQVVGLIRGGALLGPEEDNVVREGDELLAVVHTETADELARVIAGT